MGRDSLIEDQEALDNHLPNGGLYILPQKVPVDGEIEEVCFLGNKERSDLPGSFYFITFRNTTRDGNLTLVKSRGISDRNIPTNNCVFLNDISRRTVLKGDSLGIFIPSECRKGDCPLQLGLHSTSASPQTLLFDLRSTFFTARGIRIQADKVVFAELVSQTIDLNIKIIVQGESIMMYLQFLHVRFSFQSKYPLL